MPVQDLAAPFRDPAAPPRRARPAVMPVVAVFVPALLTTLLLLLAVLDWFERGGFTGVEAAMAALMAFTFFWIALSVSTATLGLFVPRRRAPEPAAGLSVAILLPVYREDPAIWATNAAVMAEALARDPGRHRHALFILSDTQDAGVVAREEEAFAALERRIGARLPVHYRNRRPNAGQKAGNIAEWVGTRGAEHDAMLALDADSLMTGAAVRRLADEMAADPTLGLVQTVPRIVHARTRFARLQQFACGVYGPALAAGLARWTGNAGNYWGHNALIRTRAFAACAGLPRLPGRGPLSGMVMSHDFVEAALLRRAGWRVRTLDAPDHGDAARGSYEETPPTLVDHALRDRRWCQGNLQHLRLLFAAGLHPVSRFHLLQGAMAYLASLAWFALLLLWAAASVGDRLVLPVYFDPARPLTPSWPEQDVVSQALVLGFVYAMLMAPKIVGAARVVASDPRLLRLGGRRRFLASLTTEIVSSVALAPIMMVQQAVAVLRVAFGVPARWTPQRRSGEPYGLRALLAFHALETVLGLAMVAAIPAGLATPWLAPIAASLVLAVPLSAWTQRESRGALLRTQEDCAPSPELVATGRATPPPARPSPTARRTLPHRPRFRKS